MNSIDKLEDLKGKTIKEAKYSYNERDILLIFSDNSYSILSPQWGSDGIDLRELHWYEMDKYDKQTLLTFLSEEKYAHLCKTPKGYL